MLNNIQSILESLGLSAQKRAINIQFSNAAYIDGGIQNLPLKDLVKIISEPNIQEWMDIETMQQAIQVAEIVYPKITTMVKVSSPAANGAYHVIKNWQK